MRTNRFIAALAAALCLMACAKSVMAMPILPALPAVLAEGEMDVPEPASLGILVLGGAASSSNAAPTDIPPPTTMLLAAIRTRNRGCSLSDFFP